MILFILIPVKRIRTVELESPLEDIRYLFFTEDGVATGIQYGIFMRFKY